MILKVISLQYILSSVLISLLMHLIQTDTCEVSLTTQHSESNQEIEQVDCRSCYVEDLNDFHVCGGLPPDMNSSQPKILLLDHNCLTTFQKAELGPSIIRISCSFNVIKSIGPFALSDLPDLKKISLRNNHIQHISSDAFKSDKGSSLPLETLDLRENKLRSIHEDAFKDLPHLTNLQLSINQFYELNESFASALNSLTNLNTLNLSNNGISELPMDLKPAVENLKVLDLTDNGFKEVPKVLQYGKKLTKLLLSRNPMSTFNSTSFIGLEQLTELDISFMPALKTVFQGAFAPLRSLQVLRCSNNAHLERIHEKAFSGLMYDGPKSMKKVELQQNKLRILEENLFSGITLDLLDITNNPFHCTCIMKWIFNKSVTLINKNLMCWLSTSNYEMDFETAIGKCTAHNDELFLENATRMNANITYIFLLLPVGIIIFIISI